PNRGCTPKKVLVAAAHALDEIERASVHGIEVATPRVQWSRLIERARNMVAFVPDAMESVARKRGDVFRGHATFIDAHTVNVDGRVLRAAHIVIATGSRPRPLAIPGAEYLTTSEDVLGDPVFPDEVIFIGGGVIALEFAHVLQRVGSRVRILEAMPRLLPRQDAEAVGELQAETGRIGVAIETDVKVVRIEPSEGRLRVHYEVGGKAYSRLADRVVNGTGRIANVGDLDLEAAGIEHDGVRVLVDEYLRSTSQPHIWVAGDALAHTAQLSPLATYEGAIVGHNILHGPVKQPDYTATPSVVHTVPALASVGLTQEQASSRGLAVRVVRNDMTSWFSGKSYGETTAFAKVLIDEHTDHIRGAHLVGHRGEELIHLFALAIAREITATELANTHFAFPTFSSDVRNLL
ncbi:MAG: NAD(P)/FAD-dependent oxidoreductase, partial [Myxococcales bacterium]|nr:NAD(P)/FAD-dependent oxidoreductase [Myxococcales bacterium]